MNGYNITDIIKAAETAGEVIASYFGKVLEIEEKTTVADIRTKADTEAEAAILQILKESFPDAGIYSEEIGKIENNSPYRFVIDPLDGSHNFNLGIPNFSVSIALAYKEETVAAVIHHPILKKTYHAEKGKGTYIDDVPLTVNSEESLKRTTVAHSCSYLGVMAEEYKLLLRLEQYGVKRIMRNWAVALDFCLLADGKIEAMINNQSEIYDFLAGKLIAKEAGAFITDLQGKPDQDMNNQFIACSSREIQEKIIQIMQDVNYETSTGQR